MIDQSIRELDQKLRRDGVRKAARDGLQRQTVTSLAKQLDDMRQRYDRAENGLRVRSDDDGTVRDILDAWRDSITQTMDLLAQISGQESEMVNYFDRVRDILQGNDHEDLKRKALSVIRSDMPGYNYKHAWTFYTEKVNGTGHVYSTTADCGQGVTLNEEELNDAMVEAILFYRKDEQVRRLYPSRIDDVPVDHDMPEGAPHSPPPSPPSRPAAAASRPAAPSRDTSNTFVGPSLRQLCEQIRDGCSRMTKAQFEDLSTAIDGGATVSFPSTGQHKTRIVITTSKKFKRCIDLVLEAEKDPTMKLADLYTRIQSNTTGERVTVAESVGVYRTMREFDTRFPFMRTGGSNSIIESVGTNADTVCRMMFIYIRILKNITDWDVVIGRAV